LDGLSKMYIIPVIIVAIPKDEIKNREIDFLMSKAINVESCFPEI